MFNLICRTFLQASFHCQGRAIENQQPQMLQYLRCRAAVVVAILFNMGGVTTLWLAATGKLGDLPLWQIVGLALVGNIGPGWLDLASLTVSIKNFPQHRGTVVGARLSFLRHTSLEDVRGLQSTL